MIEFQEIYNRNKQLDKLFLSEYGNSQDIIDKNKLELLVELGELANETKCFKYWSVKTPDRDKVLEEYADCILMVLYFFNCFNVSLDEDFPKPKDTTDILEQFTYLFNLSSRTRDEYNKDIFKEIFVNILKLGYVLGYTHQDIISGCMKKIDINMKRFEIEY